MTKAGTMRRAFVIALVASLWVARPVAAQEGEFPHGREILAQAGYRYDDTALLIQAMRHADPQVVGAAATYLITHKPTPAIVAAFREATKSTWGSVALAGFRGLQMLRETGWEDAAVERMHKDPADVVVQIELAGLLADAGRSDGWLLVRDALMPDHPGMGLAVRNAARFDGLKDSGGVDIDAVTELGRLRKDLQGRGKSADELYKVDIHVIEADTRAKERKARGKR